MDSKVVLLIFRNRAKLEKLIKTNAPYKEILRQSQLLDKYLMIQMNYMSKRGVSIS